MPMSGIFGFSETEERLGDHRGAGLHHTVVQVILTRVHTTSWWDKMDVTQRLRIWRFPKTEVPTALTARTLDTPAQDQSTMKHEVTQLADSRSLRTGAHRRGGTSLTPAQRRFLLLSCLGCWVLLSGCSAFKPLHGTPVQALPWEERGISRANMETIDLSRLGQAPLPAHYVDSGDVLAIYIEGVLGRIEEVPPVYIPQNSDSQPSLGYPIPVREDGTISLPLIRPISVRGMTIAQIEDVVRRTYTVDKQILEPGRERILVALQKARTYKVTVLRQETPNSPFVAQSGGGAIQLGQSKKGTGQIVVLPVGENDVLRALTVSGGLPGLDAQNAIYVLRRARAAACVPPGYPMPVSQKSRSKTPIRLVSGGNAYGGRYGSPASAGGDRNVPAWGHSSPEQNADRLVELEGTTPAAAWGQAPGNSMAPGFVPPSAPYEVPLGNEAMLTQPLPVLPNGVVVPPELRPYMTGGARVLRIPIRLRPGEQANFCEADIILNDGDILFIESRETEIFYTDGLLGGGQYLLPRDYDLDVLDAISIAQGRQAQGSGSGIGQRVGGIAASNQDITVSASDLNVIRHMPDGQRMNIKVDLNRALRDPNENLIIQPGDHLVLRYTPLEAVGAFIERNLLAGSLLGLAASQVMNSGGGK
ncbi:MAG: polysaccharide export protein [Planctomycetaceae bacterium]|nr:polysaccharide export protein [Planctomycetaceae bacterium]